MTIPELLSAEGSDEALAALPTLGELRRRIDEMDDRLVSLLAERSSLSVLVGRSKAASVGLDAGPVFRPGREALILRRLLGRKTGCFDPKSLVRIWREIFAASSRLQGPLAIAVFAPDSLAGHWDLARDHFGSLSPMTAFRSIGQVVRAVTDGQAAAGVLPMPEEDDRDPWWRLLVTGDASAPRIAARLPFGTRGNARLEGGDALVVAKGPPEPTGQDRSFIVVETTGEVSRARLVAALKSAALDCTFVAPYLRDGASVNLIELEGFVGGDDPRLKALGDRLVGAAERILFLGSYAVPISWARRSAESAVGSESDPL